MHTRVCIYVFGICACSLVYVPVCGTCAFGACVYVCGVCTESWGRLAVASVLLSASIPTGMRGHLLCGAGIQTQVLMPLMLPPELPTSSAPRRTFANVVLT